MKTILLALLILSSISTFAAGPLTVKQTLNTYFYTHLVKDIHMNVFEDVLDRELRKYECLQGDISSIITLEPRPKFFSIGDPGKVNLTLSTTCHNPDLTSVQFSVSGFGFDEDYTQFNLKFTTKEGSKIVTFCAYGLDKDAYKCSNWENYKPEFSTGTNSRLIK